MSSRTDIRPAGYDMECKTVLVTGATAGIGFYTARALASKGAQVLVTGRDEERGCEAVAELRLRAGHDDIHFFARDHSTVRGNRDLAERVSKQFDRLDVLINNVGKSPSSRRQETEDDYEATLATNFLGPFVLTDGLLPLLRESAPARIVNVISSAYAMWKRDPFEDLNVVERYVGIEAYARAKLLNFLWTFALARRLEGSGVVANATNPGMAWTPGTQALTPEAVPQWRWFWPLVRFVRRRASAEAASKSSVFLASSEDIAGVTGAYFESNAKLGRPSALALDVGNQERAWALAETRAQRAPTASTGFGRRKTVTHEES
jgi:NAD(P)-dependent dehydrogenase (short-subunit alcohol dehydrogenase family)